MALEARGYRYPIPPLMSSNARTNVADFTQVNAKSNMIGLLESLSTDEWVCILDSLVYDSHGYCFEKHMSLYWEGYLMDCIIHRHVTCTKVGSAQCVFLPQMKDKVPSPYSSYRS